MDTGVEGLSPGNAALTAAHALQRTAILVVAGDAALRAELEAALGAPQRVVDSCGSVTEAILLLEQAARDLVLVDCGASGGGLALVDWLSAQDRDESVVMVCGGDPGLALAAAVEALRRGVAGFLTAPPLRAEELHSAVAGALSKRRAARRERQAQEQLRESERLHRYLADSSPELIYLLDAKGCFSYVNCRVDALLGYRREELLGQHFSALVHAEDLARARYAFAERRTGERASANVELRLRLGPARREEGGGYVTVVISSYGIYGGAAGATPGFRGSYGVARDISERKRAELEISALNRSLESRVLERTAELERANKDLEAFAYSVSHDLRAPLRSIHGFSTLLAQSVEGQLTPEAEDHLARLKRNVERMDTLIDNMLEFARAGRRPLRGKRIKLGTLVRAVVLELQGDYPRAEINVGDLPEAMGDEAMLRQVFENLIGNALKFSSKRDAPRVEVRAKAPPAGAQALISVRDNGAGFDMESVDNLFGVFKRLHRESEFPGTGIGLAIVKRIVERHGGSVAAVGEMDRGATFFVTLPLAAPQVPSHGG